MGKATLRHCHIQTRGLQNEIDSWTAHEQDICMQLFAGHSTNQREES